MAFAGSVYTNLQGASSGAATMPSGIVVGQPMLAILEIDNSAIGTPTKPANWTQLDLQNPATPDGMTIVLYSRIANGNEASERTWSGMSATLNQGIIVACWTGRSGTIAFQVTSNTTANASPVTVTMTGITAQLGDDIAWCPGGDSNGVTGWVWAAPASYSLKENQDQQWVPQALATRDNVSAGGTGNLAGTLTNAGNTSAYTGWVVALRAAAAGAAAGPLGGVLTAGSLLAPASRLSSG